MCGVDASVATAVDQLTNFVKTLNNSLDPDMGDARALLDRLTVHTPAFTHEQRVTIARAVSSFMKNPSTSHTVRPSTNSQNIMHAYNYFPDFVWKVLLSKDASFDAKMDIIAKFCIGILGCRNPVERSRASMISIIMVASDDVLEPNQQYNKVHELGDHFIRKRASWRAPKR